MSERTIIPARPSATVVVIREGASGPEVLLVRRRAGDAFGDSYAFPGGVVDHDESNAYVVCEGRSEEEASEILEVDDGLDYYSAAIRELFEETGILLARDADGNWIDTGTLAPDLRSKVDDGSLPWPDFLRQQGLCMAGDALHYFAFWETPFVRSKRWQTRFFIAELPPGQEASHDGREVTDSRWLTPADALALGRRGELPMPFPTMRNLRDMSAFTSVDELLDWARGRPEEGVMKIRPIVIERDGHIQILAPGDPGYEEAATE